MRNCNSNISQLSCHLFNHQSFAFLKIKNTIPNWNKLSFFGCFVLVFLMEKKKSHLHCVLIRVMPSPNCAHVVGSKTMAQPGPP